MSFAPAAGQPAATTLHTDTEGLVHGDFALPVADGTQSAYYAAPSGQKGAPVVLVVQEIFGLHEHIKDVCRRLAKAGYFAVASNLYERQGDASTYTDIPKLVSELVAKVSDEQVFSDLDAAVAWAKTQGADASRVGVTGFCWGGRITWMYSAYSAQVKAGVAWYGKLTSGHGPLIKQTPVDVAGKLHGPVLGLYGAQDHSIPLDGVKAMEEALAQGGAASKASSFVVYPNSGHAFLADYRPSYNADDAKDGWARLLAWFERYLKA